MVKNTNLKRRSHYWKGKRVLITGHEGFLGSNLTKALLDLGAKVYGLDKVSYRPVSVLRDLRKKIVTVKGDVSNIKTVRAVIGKYKPQIVFHLAAEAIVGNAVKNPICAFKSNIEGTWNILEAARDKNFIESIVVASSDKAYGSHKKLPYTEDAALIGEYPYDVSKSCADLLCRSYACTYDVPVCVTRCGNIFGPGDFHRSRLVPDAILCALRGKQLAIRSDGTYVRDYIYVDDIVEGYIMLAEKIKKLHLAGQSFNLSNGMPVSVKNVVKRIHSMISGRVKKPRILNQASCEIKKQYLSARKARTTLGWRPRHNLTEGLRNTIAWYKNNW